MRPEEAQALSRLAGRTVADTISHVEETHRAIARRAFKRSAPGSPAEVTHNVVVDGIYGGLRAAALAGGSAIGVAAALLPRPSPRPIGSTPRGNQVLAALNAARGDQLARDQSALAIPMALRSEGDDIAPTRETLALAYPAATGKLALFLHGLGESEHSWKLHAERHYNDPSVSYGSRLAKDFGYTPLYVRYNTGLHVSENGRLLSELLSDVVAAWPTELEEITLIGHSMGGLVARSASHVGETQTAAWVPRIRHVFYLGSPHLGAPLERAASYLGWALSKLGETRPWASVVNGRSAGIKDLRFGYLLDDDWSDCDPDSCLRDHRHEVPLLKSANHYAICASVTADKDHPLGRIVGDLLVQPSSAHGRHRRGRHVPFEADCSHHLGRLNHFGLLNHPAIYELIRAALDGAQFATVGSEGAELLELESAPT